MTGQLGQLAHRVDANNTLQGKVGLQGQPAGEVIGRDWNLISIRLGKKICAKLTLVSGL